jgi:hypothetical protein
MVPEWLDSIRKRTMLDEELGKIYEEAHRESHAAALRAVYTHGQNSVVVVNTTPAEPGEVKPAE